jgi:hypothetical protein
VGGITHQTADTLTHLTTAVVSYLANSNGAATVITYIGTRTTRTTYANAAAWFGGVVSNVTAEVTSRWFVGQGAQSDTFQSIIAPTFIPFIRFGGVTGAGAMTLASTGRVSRVVLGGNRQMQAFPESYTTYASSATTYVQSVSSNSVSLTTLFTNSTTTSTGSTSFTLQTATAQTYQSSANVNGSTLGGAGAHAETTLATLAPCRATLLDASSSTTTIFLSSELTLATRQLAFERITVGNETVASVAPAGPTAPITYNTST